MAIALVSLGWSGCASQRYVVQRTAPVNPLAESLRFKDREGPQPTARTMTLLRHYDVLEVYKRDPETALDMLQELATDEKGAEKVYAIAELAYIVGKRYESERSMGKALDWYTVAVANAYLYLFSPELDGTRNPYDPQFRGACDLYNVALESTLQLVSREGNLRPGHSYRISTQEQQHEVQVVTRGPWRDEDFGELKFCSEYQVKLLDAVNVTYGIGVPMIAVRNNQDPNERGSKYYPEGLSFPVTAILRVTTPNVHSRREDHHRHPCVLELHDPLSSTDVELNSRLVPLQSDLSTPLAYFLDNPKFRQQTDSWIGLVDPNKTEKLRGIYMLEPYDPNRIPVVMVHGLWSSPLTWMPMFNDLRSFRELRKNYQFWFYQYPTGQPFWVSSAQMRNDMQELRRNLDPHGEHALLNQMVLVGHSMGGLVSRMQTLESGDEFWRILSDEPFEKVQAKPEEKEKLEAALFFHPNPSIQRVITIGTPHRGSDYSNDYTQWLGRKLITLPTSLTEMGNSLIRQNPGVFRDTGLLVTKTSIDSLSPDSPIFPAMLRARRASWVRYHNIIGILDQTRWFQSADSESDGVVDVASSHMDDVESEIVVSAGHSSIHTQPRTILEVRRILVEHLHEACQRPDIASCLEVPETWRFPEHQPPATPYHLVKSRVGSRHWVGGGQLGSSLPKIYPLKLKTPWGATKQGRGAPGSLRAPGPGASDDGPAGSTGEHPLFPSHAPGGVITVSGIETGDAAVVPAVGPIAVPTSLQPSATAPSGPSVVPNQGQTLPGKTNSSAGPAPSPSTAIPNSLPPLLPLPMREPIASPPPSRDGVRISGGQISSRQP